ncbi:serine/threonine-protein kinase [Sorangium sp. So ce1036]|uniref:serine/threonine-protein kinase n=1 Tax=Sorangium sp. So ce1036 TaxID=3133328 RepID=UPI003F022CBF
MAAAPVAVGDVLAGKYRVEQIVGSGAMGMIVAAWHLELEQRVAMKFLLSPGVGDGNPAERFRREARALARIKSEHVARVLDVGSLQDGMPYMVMEFLEGNNLADEIRARGPLPVVEAVGYILQAIEAMAEAHAAGIVHRDLKPANLFLSRRPDGGRVLKVLDFGISKSLLGSSRDELALTKTAALLGSPLYMSPEQVRSARDVDARTDIWALGVIVYQMLTGRTPYDGDSVAQLFASLLHEVPATMAQLRPDIPRELDAAVMCCLAKEPDQRWRNVGDLGVALVGFGPAGSHVHVERARRVLGLPDPGPAPFSQPGAAYSQPGTAYSQPGATVSLSGATTGGPPAGESRLSVPHGGLSPAASAETGPTANSWSNTGHAARAGRKGALLGLALAAGGALAALALGAVLFLRSGNTAGGEQAPAPAAASPPAAAAPEHAPEGAPGAASAEAPPGAASAAAPEAAPDAASAAAPEAAPDAASAAAPEAAPGAPEPPAPASSAAAPPPETSSSPAAPPTARRPAPPATPAPRPAERPRPGPGARPDPDGSNPISDFGGRR